MDYSRQVLFLGKENQEILSKKTIAIVGVGAIGSVAAELLARTGVNLILIDRDIVDETNLHRQVLFDSKDLNKLKAVQARERIKKTNPDIDITVYPTDLDYANINLIKSDIILDCVDNLETRFLLNEYAVKNEIPLVHSAAIRNRASLFNIIPGGACLRCIYKEAGNLETCDTVGVLNTITSLIASMQVNEAIKILLGKKHETNFLRINLDSNDILKIKVAKNSNCNVCKGEYPYLEGRHRSLVKLCGKDIYQIKGIHNLDLLKQRLKCEDLVYFLQFKNLSIFKDRVLIKASSEEEAKIVYSKYLGN